jgi:hypothetical protein
MTSYLLAGVLVLGCGFSFAAAAAEKLIKAKLPNGIEIGIPKGWKACDPIFDHKLGNAEDPMNMYDMLCASIPNDSGVKLAAFSPVPDEVATVIVLHSNEKAIDPDLIKAIKKEMVEEISNEICADWQKEQEADDGTIDGCSVRVDKLDRKPVLVTTLVQTPKAGKAGQSVTEIWAVPYDKGYVQFTFIWPKIMEKAVLPAIARIKKSIDID